MVNKDRRLKLNIEMLNKWEADTRLRGLAPITIDGYRKKLLSFINFLGNFDILKVDRDKIKDYLEYMREHKLATQSIAANLIAVSSFFQWAQFEKMVIVNPVPEIRSRYLQTYKKAGEAHTHKLISVAEAAKLVESVTDIRDKAMIILLFKTGIRRGELLSLEVDDIKWTNQSITLKRTAKRTNRVVFFDDETARVLKRWMAVRKERDSMGVKALWITTWGMPLKKGGLEYAIGQGAKRTGLHDSTSDQMEDHFSAHCMRHWFTTHLRRAGMPREFIQELRGDVRKEAIDIYDHIDKEELRKSYLAHIPQLGV